LVCFSPFWYVVPRKIWQPCLLQTTDGIICNLSTEQLIGLVSHSYCSGNKKVPRVI
jgi:hypothetical protein